MFGKGEEGTGWKGKGGAGERKRRKVEEG